MTQSNQKPNRFGIRDIGMALVMLVGLAAFWIGVSATVASIGNPANLGIAIPSFVGFYCAACIFAGRNPLHPRTPRNSK